LREASVTEVVRNGLEHASQLRVVARASRGVVSVDTRKPPAAAEKIRRTAGPLVRRPAVELGLYQQAPAMMNDKLVVPIVGIE